MLFKHLIGIDDIAEKKTLLSIIREAKKYIPIRKRARESSGSIRNNRHKKATFFSLEPSTRTIGSYLEASRLLGWTGEKKVGIEASSLKKKESWADTSRILAGQGADVLVIRSTEEGLQKFLKEIFEKEGVDISVQNAGDGTNEHPTQTLLDLVTMSIYLKELDNLKVGFFGDLKYGRTVHSLLKALSLFSNTKIYLASDPETALQEEYKNLFSSKNIHEEDSLEVLKECDFIYGTRIQEERFTSDSISLDRARKRFQVNSKNIGMFRKDTYFAHPLPMPKDFPQYAIEVRKDPRMIFIQQANYGIPTRMFCLEEGYTNRCLPTINEEERTEKITPLAEENLNDYLERTSKKRYKYFKPIRKGIVIDHITKGLGASIERILWKKGALPADNVVHAIKNVPTKKNGGGKKDVLIIEDSFLPDEILRIVASISPGIIFNIISEREGVFEKKKVEGSASIKGFGNCPNTNCITNHDPEAITKFDHFDDKCKCSYCGRTFYHSEIL